MARPAAVPARPAVRQRLRRQRLLRGQRVRGSGDRLRRGHRGHLHDGRLWHLRRARANLLRRYHLHGFEHPLPGRQLRGLRQRSRPDVLPRYDRRRHLHQSRPGLQRHRLHPLRGSRPAVLFQRSRLWWRRLLLRGQLRRLGIGVRQRRWHLRRRTVLELRRPGSGVLWVDLRSRRALHGQRAHRFLRVLWRTGRTVLPGSHRLRRGHHLQWQHLREVRRHRRGLLRGR